MCKRFDATRAVEDFCLECGTGEVFGLLGPDGAGKTTLIRMLAGVLTPDSGEACISGFKLSSEWEKIQELVGYVSQRFGLYPDLSVAENIGFFADIFSIPGSEQSGKVRELLELTDLYRFRDRLARNLSGGMKQKLSLCCALIHAPRLLLLDEPTNGVDPVSRRDFWNIIVRLKQEGTTVLVSTVYLDEAERCDRIGLMHEGRLMVSGSVAEIRSRMNLILEVISPETRRLRSLLLTELDSGSLQLRGDRLYVVAGNLEQTGKIIAEIAEMNQIAVSGSRQVIPNLENVFIDFMEKQVAERKVS
ncbi:MAG: ABC transporter ATP-binding protein [Candidatus Wallbacteria bacterium]|nr:ABC transporter ATP-binding protein [Candidatus Wallbacteria bacterium]